MAEESDGIEEAFEGQLRVLVTAAGQVGERIARMREEALRRSQARNEQQARELQSRFEAERRAARAELGNVYRSDWWDRASVDEVAQMYQVARAWAREDPDAVRAEQQMRTEMRTRYGLDPDGLAERAQAERDARTPGPWFEARDELDGSQPVRELTKDDALEMIDRLPADADLGPIGRGGLRDVQAWKGKDPDVDLAIASKFPHLMSRAELVALAAAEKERHRAAAEHAETQRLMQQADREDRLADRARSAAEHEPDPDERARAAAEAVQRDALGARTREDGRATYDSAERRDATASELRAKGIASDVVGTRMRADVSQARPATEAVVARTAGRSPTARKSHGRGAQAQRAGLDR
ncbi:hypothetical protein [Cellulosimicrobium cellulans]|uniref:hypothetical protein n=1 Tax=Cellulosimicrobium cellulans TaxID=1710 RepID=UPI001F063796|nr:hypothetical protein [Cellulosimicrobium cellulans]